MPPAMFMAVEVLLGVTGREDVMREKMARSLGPIMAHL